MLEWVWCHNITDIWMDNYWAAVTDCLTAISLAAVIYALYNLCFVPMNRIRKLDDVGYRHLGRNVTIQGARRRKQLGNPPPPFPNGWFVLVESRDLKKGQVKQVQALGMNLAVFRGDSGEVYITDSYCPHLGADLTVGGRVRGDCIECPFHAWRYRGDTGECTSVPNCGGKIPSSAKLETHLALERNGLVYMWHHVDLDTPNWFPIAVEEVETGEWRYRGRNEFMVNCHIQEIPENGADPGHLAPVHGPLFLLGGEQTEVMEKVVGTVVQHHWAAQWQVGEEPHIGEVQVSHSLHLFGVDIKPIGKVTAQQIGPALVHLSFNTFLGRCVMLQYVLPVEPNLQKLVHVFYSQPSLILPYAKLLLLAESMQVQGDVKIWNSKRYESRPTFVKGDRLLAQHRRWYSQFYSENSKKNGYFKSGSDLEW